MPWSRSRRSRGGPASGYGQAGRAGERGSSPAARQPCSTAVGPIHSHRAARRAPFRATVRCDEPDLRKRSAGRPCRRPRDAHEIAQAEGPARAVRTPDARLRPGRGPRGQRPAPAGRLFAGHGQPSPRCSPTRRTSPSRPSRSARPTRCAPALAVAPEDVGEILVLSGDVPLVQSDLLAELVDMRRARNAAVALVAVHSTDPEGLGRVVRSDDGGQVLRIVEEKDATPEELEIEEINAGVYAFDAAVASPSHRRRQALAGFRRVLSAGAGDPRPRRPPARGLARGRGRRHSRRHQRPVAAGGGGARAADDHQRAPHARRRHDGRSDPDVRGRHGRAGPGRRPRAGRRPARQHQDRRGDADRGGQPDHRHRRSAAIASSGPACSSPPRWRTRSRSGRSRTFAPGSSIGRKVKLGNFAEVKASRLDPGVQQHHFSYIGDAEVGERTNVGRGHDHLQLRRRAGSTGRRSARASSWARTRCSWPRSSLAMAPAPAPGPWSPGTCRRGCWPSACRPGCASLAIGAAAADAHRPGAAPCRRAGQSRQPGRPPSEVVDERRRPAAAGRPHPRPGRGGLRRGRDRARDPAAQPRRPADRRGPPRRAAGSSAW